jgi:cytochrome b6
MNNVRMGWLIRQIHTWGAHLMILMLFLHMMRVFLYGAYKPPREMNWMAGVILLFLTLTFAFTGYLLPWDQLSFWSVTVGTEIFASFPIFGKYLLLIARGGDSVTGDTLVRFFAAHVIILPIATAAFMAIHLLMVRRQGISGPL